MKIKLKPTKVRKVWLINPVTRVKESKKVYTRKDRKWKNENY